MELINSFPDFEGAFGDKRIDKKATETLARLVLGRNSSIRQISKTEAEQRSIYRLLDNASFSEQAIESRIIGRCGALSEGRHVLCIQDTVEFNLESAGKKLKPESGVGDLSRTGVPGFLLHSTLVVDAQKDTVLGFASIKTWHRPVNRDDKYKRKYGKQPMEEKESYKWLEAAKQSKELLNKARSITVVADREADIYELISYAKQQNIHVLLRSRSDRTLAGSGKMTILLNSLEVMGQYEFTVLGDIRKGITKRVAQMQVKWAEITIKQPENNKNRDLPVTQKLYVVESKENASKGICWRLLTTHPVTTFAEALQIIEWYKQRWYIEQVHRLLKTQGFRIESSQLSQGYAIRKLTLLAMMAALRVIQMMVAYEDENEQTADEIFTDEEQQCLKQAGEQMQGSTEKQSNPHRPSTIKWATWIIARLGGWKPYESQRKPGPIVLQKGLIKFYNMFEGWKLYQNHLKDVYTQ